MLTDHVRTIPLFFYFKINLSKQIGNELPVVEVAENLSSILCVFRLERNTVNSDYIVFQRQTGMDCSVCSRYGGMMIRSPVSMGRMSL